MDVRGQAADVPPVAHCPQRQQRDQRVLRGVQCPEQLGHPVEPVELRRLGKEPDRLGFERRWRQVERDDVEHLAVPGHPLVRDDLLGHRHTAEGELQAEPPLRSFRVLDRGHRLLFRLGVPVTRERVDERGAGVEVE